MSKSVYRSGLGAANLFSRYTKVVLEIKANGFLPELRTIVRIGTDEGKRGQTQNVKIFLYFRPPILPSTNQILTFCV